MQFHITLTSLTFLILAANAIPSGQGQVTEMANENIRPNAGKIGQGVVDVLKRQPAVQQKRSTTYAISEQKHEDIDNDPRMEAANIKRRNRKAGFYNSIFENRASSKTGESAASILNEILASSKSTRRYSSRTDHFSPEQFVPREGQEKRNAIYIPEIHQARAHTLALHSRSKVSPAVTSEPRKPSPPKLPIEEELEMVSEKASVDDSIGVLSIIMEEDERNVSGISNRRLTPVAQITSPAKPGESSSGIKSRSNADHIYSNLDDNFAMQLEASLNAGEETEEDFEQWFQSNAQAEPLRQYLAQTFKRDNIRDAEMDERLDNYIDELDFMAINHVVPLAFEDDEYSGDSAKPLQRKRTILNKLVKLLQK